MDEQVHLTLDLRMTKTKRREGQEKDRVNMFWQLTKHKADKADKALKSREINHENQ